MRAGGTLTTAAVTEKCGCSLRCSVTQTALFPAVNHIVCSDLVMGETDNGTHHSIQLQAHLHREDPNPVPTNAIVKRKAYVLTRAHLIRAVVYANHGKHELESVIRRRFVQESRCDSRSTKRSERIAQFLKSMSTTVAKAEQPDSTDSLVSYDTGLQSELCTVNRSFGISVTDSQVSTF